MPQAVQKRPVGNNFSLATGAAALIPGLVAQLLTGSGWIKLSYSASLINTYAGPNAYTIALMLDGAEIQDAGAYGLIPQATADTIARSFIIKAGAGQHTFELFAFSSQATLQTWIGAFGLIVEELGY